MQPLRQRPQVGCLICVFWALCTLIYQARLCFTILVDECSRALSVMNVLAMDGNNGVSFCEFVRAMSGMETADHGMVVVNG